MVNIVSVSISWVFMVMNIFSLKCSRILVSMLVVSVIGICCISWVKMFEKFVSKLSMVVSRNVFVVLVSDVLLVFIISIVVFGVDYVVIIGM